MKADKAAQKVENIHAAIGQGASASNAFAHLERALLEQQSESLNKLYDTEPHELSLSDYRCLHIELREQMKMREFYQRRIRQGEQAQKDLDRVSDKGA